MQSAYCQALVRSPSQPFFLSGMVERNPYYRRAERAIGVGRAAHVGALVSTPGFIRNQIDILDGEFEAMGREMFAQFTKQISDEGVTRANESSQGKFLNAVWTPMLNRWKNFKNDHSGFFDNLWGNVWDNLKLHRNQLVALRGSAERAGFKFNTPEPLPPEANIWDNLSFLLKILVGAAISGIAVYLGTMFIKALRSAPGA